MQLVPEAVCQCCAPSTPADGTACCCCAQHVENEWVLRSYTRAAKKQRLADTTEGGEEGR